MSVEQTSVVDIIGIDNKTDEVILTISDHLIWDSNSDHLYLLQEKINTYLSYVESGEILESYPKAKNKRVVIKIYSKFEPDEGGLIFLSKVKSIIEGAGFGFTFEQH